jgi:hypothetical protein
MTTGTAGIPRYLVESQEEVALSLHPMTRTPDCSNPRPRIKECALASFREFMKKCQKGVEKCQFSCENPYEFLKILFM